MKKKIICMIIIFCLMLIIPYLAIENKANFTLKQNSFSKSQLYELLYNEYKVEYNTETLKVLAIILQTNYSVKKNELSYMSKDDFYSKFGEKADEYYEKVEDAVDEVYKKIIIHKNNKIYIPYSYVLNSSDNNSNSEYLKNVATPWDCLKAEYKNGASNGISLNTVNHLCIDGYSYQEALNYFLKDAKITTAP